MIQQNCDLHTKQKSETKKSKTTAKNLNKKKIKSQFPSTEELLKLCRPFTVSIRRCNTIAIDISMTKAGGKLLKWIDDLQIRFWLFVFD